MRASVSVRARRGRPGRSPICSWGPYDVGRCASAASNRSRSSSQVRRGDRFVRLGGASQGRDARPRDRFRAEEIPILATPPDPRRGSRDARRNRARRICRSRDDPVVFVGGWEAITGRADRGWPSTQPTDESAGGCAVPLSVDRVVNCLLERHRRDPAGLRLQPVRTASN